MTDIQYAMLIDQLIDEQFKDQEPIHHEEPPKMPWWWN